MNNLTCPKCKSDLRIDDEDLPYEEDETAEIECYHCDKKVIVRVFITIDHDVVCADDDHRWVLSELHDEPYNGKVYAECLDCNESEFIDPKLVKTEKGWEEEND